MYVILLLHEEAKMGGYLWIELNNIAYFCIQMIMGMENLGNRITIVKASRLGNRVHLISKILWPQDHHPSYIDRDYQDLTANRSILSTYKYLS